MKLQDTYLYRMNLKLLLCIFTQNCMGIMCYGKLIKKLTLYMK